MGGEQRIDYREIVKVHNIREFTTLVRGVLPRLHGTIPTDDAYGVVLDSVPVPCTDAFVHDGKGNVLLGIRKQKPQSDRWLFGGRMVAGETFVEAVARKVYKELGGVQLRLERLSSTPINYYSLIWDERQQEPQDRGCHAISFVFAYRAEVGEFNLNCFNGEYSGLVWVPMREILRDGGRRYHPMLRQVIKDFKRYHRWVRVRRILERLCSVLGYFRR